MYGEEYYKALEFVTIDGKFLVPPMSATLEDRVVYAWTKDNHALEAQVLYLEKRVGLFYRNAETQEIHEWELDFTKEVTLPPTLKNAMRLFIRE